MNYDTIAKKVALKDVHAFEALYLKLNKLVFSISFSILKDRHLAEDITQDTFVTIWEKTSEFRGVGYKSWILTIARNKSLNEYKKRNKTINVDFSENQNMFGDYNINEKIEKSNVLDIIALVLDEEERQIVLLKNSGMKIKEIAQFLNKPRRTISWKYSEIINKLKKILIGENNEN